LIDAHIHIGQFEELYYDPLEVLTIVFEAGVDELVFSSATSCKDSISYGEVEAEIATVLSKLGPRSPRAKPLFWYVPDYANQGVTVETAMNSLPYCGFKIHPRAHQWDLGNIKTMDILHGLCDYADRKELSILIHTGEDAFEEASKFSALFPEYPGARFILAHGRPLEQTVSLLRRFPNVYCDTAFMPVESFDRIAMEGLAEKAIFGTDFPITHYFQWKYGEKPIQNNPSAWRKQYAEDILGAWRHAKQERPASPSRISQAPRR
jgi:predicted TIM-barrel fold metal-dependent hydrolase